MHPPRYRGIPKHNCLAFVYLSVPATAPIARICACVYIGMPSLRSPRDQHPTPLPPCDESTSSPGRWGGFRQVVVGFGREGIPQNITGFLPPATLSGASGWWCRGEFPAAEWLRLPALLLPLSCVRVCAPAGAGAGFTSRLLHLPARQEPVGQGAGTRCSPMRGGPRQRSGAALRGWLRAGASGGAKCAPSPRPGPPPSRPGPARPGPARPAAPGARRGPGCSALCTAGGHGQRQPGQRERPRRCSRLLAAG